MELYTVCLMFASKYEVKKKIIKKHKNLSSELWLIFFHPSRMFLHELPELVPVPIPSDCWFTFLYILRNHQPELIMAPSQLNMEHYFQRKDNISDFARNQESRIYVL